jgi:hypothetical protein
VSGDLTDIRQVVFIDHGRIKSIACRGAGGAISQSTGVSDDEAALAHLSWLVAHPLEFRSSRCGSSGQRSQETRCKASSNATPHGSPGGRHR